jgi:16S rRNA (uracil1498-N3)-methyltransferase
VFFSDNSIPKKFLSDFNPNKMNIFYLPEIQSGDIILNEEESGHAVKVLRLKENDPVTLVDGKGILIIGEITIAHPKKCKIKALSIKEEFGKKNYRLHLVVAPTKNSDRMEWLIEKATEIGLDEFTPMICRHSERKQIHTNRLVKVDVAAMKQSLKAYLPVIHEMVPFEKFISQNFQAKKFIAHCAPGEKPHLFSLIRQNEDILVLIGPEGDFSPDEIALAKQHGFQEISLGNSRLRTETAAFAAVHTIILKNEIPE